MINENEITFIPANSNNYMIGRNGTPVRRIAFHHVTNTAATAISRFQQNVQVSAHFIVAPDAVYCMVDTDNTAYTNGNWASNLESVTIEHEGDWRFGYYNQAVIDNSVRLVAWLRTLYPDTTPIRHRDVSSTACPGDLPVELIWNRASEILNPTPVPIVAPAAKLNITDIQNRTVVLNKDTSLWDLTFTSWAEVKAVKPLANGTEIEISATATHPLGGTYYMTEYSFAKGINYGINVNDCDEKPVPVVIEDVTPVEPVVIVVPIPTPKPPVKKPIWWRKVMRWLSRHGFKVVKK